MLLQDQADSLARIPVLINAQDSQADSFFHTTGNTEQYTRQEKKICEFLMLGSSGKEQDKLDLSHMANLMSLDAIKICMLLQYAAQIDFGSEKNLSSAEKFPFSSTIPCSWFASKISLGSSATSGNGSATRIVSMGSHYSSSRGSRPDDIELFGAVYVRRAVFACGPRYVRPVPWQGEILIWGQETGSKRTCEMADQAAMRREVLHTDFLTLPILKEPMLVLEKLGDAKVITHEGYPQAECCWLSVGHPDAIINVSMAVAALSVVGNFRFHPFSHGEACMTRAPSQKLLSSTKPALHDNANLRWKSLILMSKVEMLLPTNIGDYTDFFASLHHATNCGTIFHGKANPVPLNWSYLPIAYHGCASSVVISRTGIVRPSGQASSLSDSPPSFEPLQKLDFEREMATVASPGNELGTCRERYMTTILDKFEAWSSVGLNLLEWKRSSVDAHILHTC
ncbi:hypothetical protein Nepgr_015163 [Nepenthes gracilis]|uniref:Fumarylacetoacetase n=1 Tax=Nepenthes gracilis TaxID=150966 RepID=A0AAD3SMS2_NEPGR|nr:hypothetical protein Nepgr_015163 [Nepenthes gracilis]